MITKADLMTGIRTAKALAAHRAGKIELDPSVDPVDKMVELCEELSAWRMAEAEWGHIETLVSAQKEDDDAVAAMLQQLLNEKNRIEAYLAEEPEGNNVAEAFLYAINETLNSVPTLISQGAYPAPAEVQETPETTPEEPPA